MQIVERTNRSFVIDGITDREVRSRNFAGQEKKDRNTGRTVNSPGYRNFLLFINEEIAAELQALGCEVKYTRVINENDVPTPYVSVSVSYFLKPVEIVTISNGVATQLDAEHAYVLDNMDFKNVCMEIETGKEKVHNNGVRYTPLYAQKIWAEITPNYFAEKYSYLNQAGTPAEATPF